MTCRTDRRGSALLIVLGLMSFILISAIAFSAYMRQARLPSSYLRRSSASRMLAKAALAEAIDRIDAAIGNNPHPGMGDNHYRHPRDNGDLGERNSWVDHVFVGTNATSLVPPSETVSTLCLEGLAYVPPPLINEARYYSRRSTAARWHDLGFDSGRYAFCAIDVSDCFDVNRVTAGSGLSGGSEREIPAGRNSSDTGRITLGHAFENSSHSGYTVKPSDWDKFMDKFLTDDGRAVGTKVPLVSVADLNLAIRSDPPAGIISPFCRFIDGGTAFVTAETGSEADLIRGMAFVTDSWFPRTGAVLDLENPVNQPFHGLNTRSSRSITLDTIAQNTGRPFMTKFSGPLSWPNCAMLFDYLDEDSAPISLALPVTERTPMIAGLCLSPSMEVRLSAARSDYKVDIVPNEEWCNVSAYSFKMEVRSAGVVLATVFPFKYSRGAKKSFKVQAAATVALVKKSFINSNADLNLRLPNSAGAAVAKNDWPNMTSAGASASVAPPFVTLWSQPVQVNYRDDVLKESEAVSSDQVLTLGSGSPVLELTAECPQVAQRFNKDTCTFRTSQRVKKDPDTGAETPVGDPVNEYAGVQMYNGDLSGPVNLGSAVASDEFIPVVQVWARIIDANGDTVDLVPASVSDDRNMSSLVSLSAAGSRGLPLLRFIDGGSSASVKFDQTGLDAISSPKVALGGASWPKAYVADDPRFNYAPENMLAMDSLPSQIGKFWLDQQTTDRARKRDGDIFMTVSDAGYLQSIFELANLLRFTDFQSGSTFAALNSGYNGKIRIGAGFAAATPQLAADDAMWRTYSQYSQNGGSDDIEGVFDGVVSGTRGFRASPHSTSWAMRTAVVANTPLDWWAASTNKNDSAKLSMLKTVDEAGKYTFSEFGDQVAFNYKDVGLDYAEYSKNPNDTLAGWLFGAIAGRQDWKSAYDGLAWDAVDTSDDAKRAILGMEPLAGSDMLHSVDRKFLHGFWRECIDARQQLFLVFVRAEPLMMGGGAKGMTPPQLGARAVALVWRDPTPTIEDAGTSQPRPHRTRLLFYRQFD